MNEGLNKTSEQELENKFTFKEGEKGVYKDVYLAQIENGKIVSSEKVDLAKIEGSTISFIIGNSEGTASNTQHTIENNQLYAIIDYASDIL